MAVDVLRAVNLKDPEDGEREKEFQACRGDERRSKDCVIGGLVHYVLLKCRSIVTSAPIITI